tara:strand:- start:102 stop:551 length:450 start_codon:yes stop_codon:yes gene_type:complete
VILILPSLAEAYLGTQRRLQQFRGCRLDGRTFSSSGAPQLSTRDTRLYLDLFGLGPSEIVIVAVVAGLLYGPDRLRGQLRDSGVSNSVVNSKGLRLEREERIGKMLDDAEIRRNKRAWQRVNALIDAEDEATLQRLEELNTGEGTFLIF